MRREWIEIRLYRNQRTGDSSPSMRREWIEIITDIYGTKRMKSPSMRREWIEMLCVSQIPFQCLGLPPCGGSGLKFPTNLYIRTPLGSPSMRREWIEIDPAFLTAHHYPSPSMRREWIEMLPERRNKRERPCLPPCGGSGLKSRAIALFPVSALLLPPCGGSGLKCCLDTSIIQNAKVSLHAEGVD